MRTFDDPFLGHMRSCEILPAALQEVDQVLATYPGEHVFFGPSMEFLYAGRKIPSPLHLPNWWDPGTSFPLARAKEISQAWDGEHFSLLLFTAYEDREKLTAGIRDTLSSKYTRVGDTKLIHVYQLRNPKDVLQLPSRENPLLNLQPGSN